MPLVLVDQTRPGPQTLTQRARAQARLPRARCLLLGAAGEASGDPGSGLRKDFTAGQLRAAVLSALAISHRSLVRPPPVPRGPAGLWLLTGWRADAAYAVAQSRYAPLADNLLGSAAVLEALTNTPPWTRAPPWSARWR